ncbi:class I SAM-dependent methyltransferase [Salinadaptatus halalkaliphilus]|uniref:class I SAM-dependent methyltransferase n=1 Tax=Salinadaptatus halalkaliphilus TaxID=2419781 RepID=UPI0015809C63|nr:class I SAM-dependent methyltransferase [Salinadaptatus halalkaliphilus]
MTDEESPPDHGWLDSSGGPAAQESMATLRRFVADLPPGRALDVATGGGHNAIFLAKHGWAVDAVDISRVQLEQARERAASRDCSIEWVLGDVDRYGFPTATYDVISIGYFDARDRFQAITDALAPGGVLVYEHYLASPAEESRLSDDYRFRSNELLSACSNLQIRWYVEWHLDGEPRVALLAQRPGSSRRLVDLQRLDDANW